MGKSTARWATVPETRAARGDDTVVEGTGGAGGTRVDQGTGGVPGMVVLPPGNPTTAGLRPLRRLTNREYNNTVRDLLGETSHPADAFPPNREDGFLFHRAGLMSSADLETQRTAAEALAATAVKNAGTLAPCAGAAEDACARTFITSFGLRAYRRPLAPEESQRLVDLYQAGRTKLGLDHAGAIGLLVEGMLQSPAFTYHWEMGSEKPLVEEKLVRLGAFEMASQLSYIIYGSMPDQALFDAAAGNKLGTQAEVEAQARRMLADPKAREGIAAFVVEWLSLDRVGEKDKEKAAYPEYNDGLVDAMGAEAQAFVKNIAFEGDAKFESLLTAKFTFTNQALAGLYGIKGAQGAEMKQSPLDPAQRSGLLTQAAFLSLNAKPEGSSPVKRGKAVYTGLLCGELPPPPNVVPPVKPASAGGTTRDRFTEHDTNPCAKACHKLMDPIGFGFERYDGIGRYRTTDNNLPVDSKS